MEKLEWEVAEGWLEALTEILPLEEVYSEQCWQKKERCRANLAIPVHSVIARRLEG